MQRKVKQIISPELLESAYRQGIFPMADDDGNIGWYSPDPRAILPIEQFHISQTLAATIRKDRFAIRIDTAFEAVMRACGQRDQTWISEEIIAAYTTLHRLGKAHSIEAWQGERLVGGLYGVALGGAFFGESMFSRATDASKVCLAFITRRLQERGFILHDCQFHTPHLARFGLQLLPRREYLQRLATALSLDCRFA